MGGTVIGCGHNAIFGMGVVTTPYLVWAWFTDSCEWAWLLSAVGQEFNFAVSLWLLRCWCSCNCWHSS